MKLGTSVINQLHIYYKCQKMFLKWMAIIIVDIYLFILFITVIYLHINLDIYNNILDIFFRN